MYDFVQFANQHDHVFRAPLKYLSEADARLIAAAPELFDCLQRCLDEMAWIGPKAKKTAEDSHAALAKARGEIND
jgi:hypothetical protein